MRRWLLLFMILAAVGGTGVVTATPAVAAKAPVKIKGKVNNHGTTTVHNGTTTIELDDFYFAKTFQKVKPGSTVTVELENEGSATHTFTIDKLGVDEQLAPGSKASVTVDIPKSGVFVFYCRFHRSMGMTGAFYTKSGTKATSSRDGSGSGSYGY